MPRSIASIAAADAPDMPRFPGGSPAASRVAAASASSRSGEPVGGRVAGSAGSANDDACFSSTTTPLSARVAFWSAAAPVDETNRRRTSATHGTEPSSATHSNRRRFAFFSSWSDEPAVSEVDGRTTDARTVLTYARSYEGARTAYSSTVREPLTTATARADAPSGRGTTTSQCDFAGTPRMMHSGGVLPVVTFLIRRSNAPSSDAEMTLTRFASASTSWLPSTSTRQLHVGGSPPMPSAGDMASTRAFNCEGTFLVSVGKIITRASRRA